MEDCYIDNQSVAKANEELKKQNKQKICLPCSVKKKKKKTLLRASTKSIDSGPESILFAIFHIRSKDHTTYDAVNYTLTQTSKRPLLFFL